LFYATMPFTFVYRTAIDHKTASAKMKKVFNFDKKRSEKKN